MSVAGDTSNGSIKIDDATPQYKPIHQITDTQPVRATCFHPSGQVYVVGSNSKQLRICIYPSDEELQDFTGDDPPSEPTIACKFLQIHRASIYCVAFNQAGNLLATGSNDQTVHVINYDSALQEPRGGEFKLTMHSGTVRDLCFLHDTEQDTSLLVTAGAGEHEIFITDCKAMKPTMMLRGHEDSIMSVHRYKNDDSTTFFSGSLDGTIRVWDRRSKACTSIISTNRPGGDAISGGNQGGTPVGSIRVDDTGKLLVSGHTDGRCMLYDIRGGRIIQLFKAHEDEIRTVSFSPRNRYLLTGSYDHRVKMMDLQGDLTRKLPSVDIVELSDKVIQTAWHSNDYNFITTSAGGSATLWTMPGLARKLNNDTDGPMEELIF